VNRSLNIVLKLYFSPKSYPANFAKEGKEHSTCLLGQRGWAVLCWWCLEYIKVAYMSSSSYMYSNLNYRALATVFANILHEIERGSSKLRRLVGASGREYSCTVIPTDFHLSAFFVVVILCRHAQSL